MSVLPVVMDLKYKGAEMMLLAECKLSPLFPMPIQ